MSSENIHTIEKRLIPRKKKAEFLGHRGGVFWMCGLSGSGKSTLAISLEKSLLKEGINSIILDGDNLRAGLNKDLGFSMIERMENIRLVDGKNSFEYEDTFVLRGLKELHIAFDARH